MIDSAKRRTIQLFGLTPLVSIPLLSVPLAATAAQVSDSYSCKPNVQAMSHTNTNEHYGMALQIQIVHSSAIPDKQFIVSNTTDEHLVVSRFMPGVIYFDNQIMDLNEAINHHAVSLESGQSKVIDFVLSSVDNSISTEYVWADHAMEKLSHETSVITLGAFMADTNAVVYVNTRSSIFS